MRLDQTERIDSILLRQHGIVATAQLTQLGLSDSQIHRVHRAERWSSPVRGIHLSPAFPLGRLQLMVSACLLCQEASVGFTTAGQELGLRGMAFDQRVHVLIPHECRLVIPGVVVHRCRRIDPVDLGPRRPDGIRFTSPARTVLDAASIIGRDRTESAIEQLLAERRCPLATLISTARRLHHHLRPGSTVFLEVLESRPALRRAARSDLERVVLEEITARGLPVPEVNMRHRLRSGDVIEIDLAWVEWKVAGEVDHPFWHDGARESAKDKRRDRKLQAEGWATPRLPEKEINESLGELIDDLGNILMQRGWRPATVPMGL